MSSDAESTIDDRIRDNVADILFFMLGVIMLQIAIRLWGMLPPDAPLVAVTVILAFAWSLFLLVLAVWTTDTGEYGHFLAAVTLGILVLATVAMLRHLPLPYLGTDVALFTTYAADLTLKGQNPYAASMLPSMAALDIPTDQLQLPGFKTAYITPKTDGTVVTRLSYPAGAVLIFLPQMLLGIGRPDMLATLVVPVLALVAFLIRITPPRLAALPLLVTLAPRNMVISSLGGINDGFWVLPLVVTIVLWARDRRGAAGITYGLACAMKQQPWFCAPFLAYWLYADRGCLRAALPAWTRFFGPAAVVFGVINLPFALADPVAWLNGVFTPLQDAGAPLITQGFGLALLTTADVAALPKWYYLVVMVAWALVLLALYAIYFPRSRWMAWIVPALILMANYRSLPTYAVYVAPPAFAAFLAHHQLLWLDGDYWAALDPRRAPEEAADQEVAA